MSPRILLLLPLAAALAVPVSARAFPCDPQPLVQRDASGNLVLVVRDPTQPCAYDRVTIPLNTHP